MTGSLSQASIWRARRLLPKPFRQRVRSLTRWPVTLRIVSDRQSFVNLRRVENTVRVWPPDITSVPVRVRALGHRPVSIRPGTADSLALVATFDERFHLPPAGLPDAPGLIWDLGANIGLTVAHLAYLYPTARIVGVELDDANAGEAEHNIAPWSPRCSLLRGAVCIEDGTVQYVRNHGHEQGFHIGDVRAGEAANLSSARAIRLSKLSQEYPDGAIDYVKMDIEGAEREVLRVDTDWAKRVRTINVEVHHPYTVGECAADLHALGFVATVSTRHPAQVTGVRGQTGSPAGRP